MNEKIVEEINSVELGEQGKLKTKETDRYQLLQEYIRCLQKQNNTKNVQRQTLYAQLERLSKSVQSLEQQLAEAKSQRCSSERTKFSQMSTQEIRQICSLERNKLKDQIRDLEQEVTILKYEQHHLFEENLSLITNSELTSNKLVEVERENKDLKFHKEELEQFKIALQKITQNLQNIEIERFALTQTNMELVEENSYLRRVLSERHEFVDYQQQQLQKGQQETNIFLSISEAKCFKDYHRQPEKVTSVSNYLLSNSFEKISEYEEEYQESNGNSISRNDDGSRYNTSKREQNLDDLSDSRPVHQWKEENNQSLEQRNQRNYQERSLRSIKDVDCHQKLRYQQNQSSYIICDERSGQSFGLSFQMHHSQRISNNPHNILNDERITSQCMDDKKVQQQQQDDENEQQIEQGQEKAESKFQVEYQKAEKQYKEYSQSKYKDESSNDVIQQMNEQSSLSQFNQQMHVKTDNQQKQSFDEMQSLKRYIQSLDRQMIIIKQQLQQSQSKRQSLQKRIKQMQRTQSKNINQMQQKIQNLLNNYELIVNYTQELEQDNALLYQRNQVVERQKHQIEEENIQVNGAVRQLFNNQEIIIGQRDQLVGENQELSKEKEQLTAQLEQLKLYCTRAQQYIDSINQNHVNQSINSNHIKQTISPINFPSTHKAPYQNYPKFTPQMDYFQLIKQNNQLIQRVNQLQQENSSLYHKINSNYSNHSSRSRLNQQNDKENATNYLNLQLHLPATNQKFLRTHQNYHEKNHCNPKKTSLSFRSQIDKQQSIKRTNSFQAQTPIYNYCQTDKGKVSEDQRESLKNKLQKRIQSIKQKNLQLLNQLEYY